MRTRNEKAHIIKKCIACGEEFESHICKKRKYCSYDCYSKTGLVKARLGNKSRTGNQDSIETRIRKSEAQKGNKSHYWRGGITLKNAEIRNSIELRLWREAVFARDNWTCQDCNKRGSIDLNAHHIKSFAEYPSLRTSISNGITLCEECHKLRHKKI